MAGAFRRFEPLKINISEPGYKRFKEPEWREKYWNGIKKELDKTDALSEGDVRGIKFFYDDEAPAITDGITHEAMMTAINTIVTDRQKLEKIQKYHDGLENELSSVERSFGKSFSRKYPNLGTGVEEELKMQKFVSQYHNYREKIRQHVLRGKGLTPEAIAHFAGMIQKIKALKELTKTLQK
ncbi:hypothetical protein H0N96_02595, partial [Candidatus Micrarchaeota archaeon]|nr:hypothetical protein [Candidatus Micrarchaeota archaeon]